MLELVDKLIALQIRIVLLKLTLCLLHEHEQLVILVEYFESQFVIDLADLVYELKNHVDRFLVLR